MLPDDIAGRLFKHIYAYVNDENPTSDELLINLVFEPIKLQLKRDLKDWESEKTQRSDAGKKGMEARWAKHNEVKKSITTDNTVINPITNITDTVTVNVTDTVTVKENTIEHRKLKFADSLKPFLEKYGKDLCNDFYKYWTQPNKSGSKFKQELEKTWELSYRLERWSQNDKSFNKQENQELAIPKLTFKNGKSGN